MGYRDKISQVDCESPHKGSRVCDSIHLLINFLYQILILCSGVEVYYSPMKNGVSNDILELIKVLYGRVTNLWTFPEVIYTYGTTQYEPSTQTIKIARKDNTKEFTILHEAFHYFQDVVNDEPFDEPIRNITDNNVYIWIRTEREANVFAYKICKEQGWAIPDYFPRGYFE